MANSADPLDPLDLHCLQRQAISGFSMTRVKVYFLYSGQTLKTEDNLLLRERAILFKNIPQK